MPHTATGRFTVELTPQGAPEEVDGVSIGRMSIAKRFEGGLQGSSRGQMLSAMTPVPGSAGYVAIERVTGTLDGRPGSFALQHSGTMHGGSQQLSITVVPGSGTGALAGLGGDFALRIEDGLHLYTLTYELPG